MAKKPAIVGYFDYSKYLKHITDPMGFGDMVVPDMFSRDFTPNRMPTSSGLGIAEILGTDLMESLSSGKAVLALTEKQREELDQFGNWVFKKMLDYGTDEDYSALRREFLMFVDKKKPKGKKIIIIMPSDEYIVEK